MNQKVMSIEDLENDIKAAEQRMGLLMSRIWERLRIEPERWSLEKYGDLVGGFWIVGLLGRKCLYYNEIEKGYNWGKYS